MFTSQHRDLSFERALDAAVQCYLDWRQESSTCESAYRVWTTTTARSGDRRLAFAAYTAALDREEQAAGRYGAAAAVLR
jgi:hypothetical protein